MSIALDAGCALLLFLAGSLSQHWVASLIDFLIGLVLCGGPLNAIAEWFCRRSAR